MFLVDHYIVFHALEKRVFEIHWTELSDLLGEFIDDLCESFTFGSRNPFEPQPFRFNAVLRENSLEQQIPPQSLIIPLLVMAIARMASRDEDSVRAFRECLTTNAGSTRPLHITRIDLTFGAYLMRAVPARSAPVYEHQLHKNPTIFGSNLIAVSLQFPSLSGDR